MAVAVAGVGAGGCGLGSGLLGCWAACAIGLLGCWAAWAAARARVASQASVVASRALMLLTRARARACTLLPSLTRERGCSRALLLLHVRTHTGARCCPPSRVLPSFRPEGVAAVLTGAATAFSSERCSPHWRALLCHERTHPRTGTCMPMHASMHAVGWVLCCWADGQLVLLGCWAVGVLGLLHARALLPSRALLHHVR